MKPVTSLNSAARQAISLVLDDGTVADMTLEWVDNQQGWFYSLSYAPASFAVNNQRLVNAPNVLRQFREIIPFGLGCYVPDGGEPWLQTDFISGRVTLLALTAADVATIEERILNG